MDNRDYVTCFHNAKSLSKSGNCIEAKRILLELHETNPMDLDVLYGLIGVCRKLEQFEDALDRYQITLTLEKDTKRRALSYIKMGNLLSKLKNFVDAESMYKESLKLDPLNALCLFKYGQLLETNKNPKGAQQKYSESILIQPTALKFYCYGRLLMEQFNDLHAAKTMFEKAAQADPNNEKYAEKYNSVKQICDAEQEQKVQNYTMNIDAYKQIKIIIYNFESMILFKPYDNESKDSKMREIFNLFGGHDRILKLNEHFHKIMNIRLKIILHISLHENIIRPLMERAQFDFNFLCHCQIMDNLEGIYGDSKRDETVYVDDKMSGLACNYCQILIMKRMHPLSGLTIVHLQQIEKIFHLQPNPSIIYSNHVGVYPFPFQIPLSMIAAEIKIYNAIKTETQGMRRGSNQNVQSLQVFMYLQKEKSTWQYRACFTEFIWKWKDVQTAQQERMNWTAVNMLLQLLEMEANDYQIYMELGCCFSYLKMDAIANEYYRQSLQLKPDSYSTHKSFAMHLVTGKCWNAAVEHFDFCINECKSDESERDMKRSNFLIRYAQTMDHADAPYANPDIAEKYYKLAILADNKRNVMHTARHHESYGQFLSKLDRFDEALAEYNVALRLQPKNEWTHWKVALIFERMGKKEECRKHLEEALDINPNHRFALRDYNKYVGAQYVPKHHLHHQNDEDDEEYKENTNDDILAMDGQHKDEILLERVPPCALSFYECKSLLDLTQSERNIVSRHRNEYIVNYNLGIIMVFIAPTPDCECWKVYAISISPRHGASGNSRCYIQYFNDDTMNAFVQKEQSMGLVTQCLARPTTSTLILNLNRLHPTSLRKIFDSYPSDNPFIITQLQQERQSSDEPIIQKQLLPSKIMQQMDEMKDDDLDQDMHDSNSNTNNNEKELTEQEMEELDELEEYRPIEFLGLSPCTDIECGFIYCGNAKYAQHSVINNLAVRLFTLEESLKVGAVIDARDFTGKWYQAEVIAVQDEEGNEYTNLDCDNDDYLEIRRAKIHYLGYSQNYDEWLFVDTDSHRIAQRGTFTVGPDLRAIRRNTTNLHAAASSMNANGANPASLVHQRSIHRANRSRRNAAREQQLQQQQQQDNDLEIDQDN